MITREKILRELVKSRTKRLEQSVLMKRSGCNQPAIFALMQVEGLISRFDGSGGHVYWAISRNAKHGIWLADGKIFEGEWSKEELQSLGWLELVKQAVKDHT